MESTGDGLGLLSWASRSRVQWVAHSTCLSIQYGDEDVFSNEEASSIVLEALLLLRTFTTSARGRHASARR